jgi:hypothetical protein
MKRRSNNALYFTDDLLRKVLEHKPVQLWELVNMLFPRETNVKQFECALKLLQTLEKRDKMSNIEALEMFSIPNERYMLTGSVVSKLKKFGVVETDGNNGSKKYYLKLSGGFSQILRDIGLDLHGFYWRHANETKQLEGNTH